MNEENYWSTKIDLTKYPIESIIQVEVYVDRLHIKGILDSTDSESVARREWSKQIRVPHYVNSSTVRASMDEGLISFVAWRKETNAVKVIYKT